MAKAKYEVTGAFSIQGTDGEPVAPGGTVELDDAVINVRALVEGGLVKPASAAAAKATKASGGGDG